jgi:hypothetical protein
MQVMLLTNGVTTKIQVNVKSLTLFVVIQPILCPMSTDLTPKMSVWHIASPGGHYSHQTFPLPLETTM